MLPIKQETFDHTWRHVYTSFSPWTNGRLDTHFFEGHSKSVAVENESAIKADYHQTPNISRTKIQNLNVSRLTLQLSLRILLKPGVKSKKEVVGAAPTGDAPSTSEW